MDFIERLLPEFDIETNNTRKILQTVPEGQFAWKPHAKSMSLGRLAGHVAEMPSWAVHTLEVDTLELTPAQKGFNPANHEELMHMFDQYVSQARSALARATDEQLRATWCLKLGSRVVIEMPRAAVIRSLVMNHMIHHRGQLSVYLRLLEVGIPGMYGPSADEGSGFPAE